MFTPQPSLASVLSAVLQVGHKIDVLQGQVTKGFLKMTQLDTEIAALQASVTSLTTTVSSATALIGGFSNQLAAAIAAAQAAGATPAELQQLTDLQTSIDSNTAKLAAAVAANTTPPSTAAGS